MIQSQRSPVYVFDDMSSTGIDTVVDGAIVYILSDGTGNAFRTIKVTSSAAATATTTIDDFIKNHAADYVETQVNEKMRRVYTTLPDLKADITLVDWQISHVKDTGDSYVFEIEPVSAKADPTWIRDARNLGYLKPVGGAWTGVADADLDMNGFRIFNTIDPRPGKLGDFDLVPKLFMQEAIAAGSLFQGAVSDTAVGGAVEFGSLPLSATGNKGQYWVWAGISGFTITTTTEKVGAYLDGEVLQVGDWIQSNGAGWVHISGDLLNKKRGDGLYGIKEWADIVYEKGSIVSANKFLWRARFKVPKGKPAPQESTAVLPGTMLKPGAKVADFVDAATSDFAAANATKGDFIDVTNPFRLAGSTPFPSMIVKAGDRFYYTGETWSHDFELNPNVSSVRDGWAYAPVALRSVEANPDPVDIRTGAVPLGILWEKIDLYGYSQRSGATAFVGKGQMDITNITPATHYAMPSNTVPDPDTVIPKNGDTYYDLDDGALTTIHAVGHPLAYTGDTLYGTVRSFSYKADKTIKAGNQVTLVDNISANSAEYNIKIKDIHREGAIYEFSMLISASSAVVLKPIAMHPHNTHLLSVSSDWLNGRSDISLTVVFKEDMAISTVYEITISSAHGDLKRIQSYNALTTGSDLSNQIPLDLPFPTKDMNYRHIAMTKAAFDAISTKDEGVIYYTWK